MTELDLQCKPIEQHTMPEHAPLNILLLHNYRSLHTGTVRDHITAFNEHSRHNICLLDTRAAAVLSPNLTRFDVIVIHYSIPIVSKTLLPSKLRTKLASFAGPKICFIQDELRWVDNTTKSIKELGIQVLFTVVNKDAIAKIYHDNIYEGVRFEQTLTGFVPEHLLKRVVPAYADRTIDVSYRARKLPAWSGSFGQEKWQIGVRFLEDAKNYDLKCDIKSSEVSRIYGENWINFVANSKAVLGTESGFSFVDFSGSVMPAIDQFQAKNPVVGFEVIKDKFLEDRDGEITVHVVSPRVFEAAALKTLMIMYPGDYSGCVTAHRHYVPLERDHSNMAEVVEILRDSDRAQEIINNAYRKVAHSPDWTHKSFIAHFDRVASEEAFKMAQRIKARVTNMAPQPHVEQLEGLEKEGLKLAKRQAVGFNFAMALAKLQAQTEYALRRHLPNAWARGIVGMLQNLQTKLKPALKNILLGKE